MNKVALARLQTSLAYLFLGGLVVLVLFPFYWMTITSFKSEDQMRSLVSMFWPSPVVLENYWQLLTKTDFLSWYRNSAIVGGASRGIVSSTSPGTRWMRSAGYFVDAMPAKTSR